MNKLILTTLFSFIINITNAQFIKIPSPNTSENIFLLSKIDNNILLAGQDTFISKSINNCNSYTSIHSPTPNIGYSIVFQTDTTHYFLSTVVGSNTLIYKTSNGGTSWDLKFNSDSIITTEFQMFDSLNGVIIGDDFNFLYTNDGCNTWYKENHTMGTPDHSVTFGDSIICICSRFPWCIGYSSDQGHNWIWGCDIPYQANFINISLYNSSSIYLLSFSNFLTPYFSYSLDKNSTWDNKIMNIHFSHINYIKMSSINEGYVLGDSSGYGILYKTTDTGTTWYPINTHLQTSYLNMIWLNDSIALLSGTNGYLVKWNKNTFATEIVNIYIPKNQIIINPNPATNEQIIHLQLNKNANVKIDLLNMQGQFLKTICNKLFNSGSTDITNSVSDLANGIYFYNVYINGEMEHIKFLKQ